MNESWSRKKTEIGGGEKMGGGKLRVGRVLGKRKEYMQGLGEWVCEAHWRKNGKGPIRLEH